MIITIMPKVPIAISASLKVDMDQQIGLLTVNFAADAPNIDFDDIG